MLSDNGIVLVTGAAGFLGPHVCAALGAAGWRVRKATRDPRQAAAPGAAFIPGLNVATDWKAALDGVSAIVHLAARAHRSQRIQSQEQADYKAVNTHATLQLARSAAAQGVGRFIFMSSIAVHGATSEHPLSESDPFDPISVYGQTKAAAETGLREIALEHLRMSIAAIRPPLVYGAGAKGNFALLQRLVRAGAPLPFGAIDNKRAFVSADNVASFVVHLLARRAAGFDAYIVADDEQVSTPDFVRRLANALKVRPRLAGIPLSVLKIGLRLAGRAELIDSLLGSLVVSTAKAKSTGWQPPLSLDEGLARAVSGDTPPRID